MRKSKNEKRARVESVREQIKEKRERELKREGENGEKTETSEERVGEYIKGKRGNEKRE